MNKGVTHCKYFIISLVAVLCGYYLGLLQILTVCTSNPSITFFIYNFNLFSIRVHGDFGVLIW